MKFDAKLAERICREMGIEYHPEQEGVLIGGKKLPDNFSTAELFQSKLNETFEDPVSHVNTKNYRSNASSV